MGVPPDAVHFKIFLTFIHNTVLREGLKMNGVALSEFCFLTFTNYKCLTFYSDEYFIFMMMMRCGALSRRNNAPGAFKRSVEIFPRERSLGVQIILEAQIIAIEFFKSVHIFFRYSGGDVIQDFFRAESQNAQ